MTDWSRIVVPGLAELEPLDIERTVSDVLLLEARSEGMKLDWNESSFGPLPGVGEAIKEELESAWMYPIAPYHHFRADVARFLWTTQGRIAPGHGTQALIGTVASTFLRPGDRVVVPEVTFYLYAQVSAARGAIVHHVPMRDLHIDLPTVADTAREVGARLVWICDPNNPTGIALERPEWDDFLAALPPRCVVVADEAYVDYLPPERRLPRVADVESGRPVVVLRSFSKFYGLAGLRLGYSVADEALVACFNIVEEPFNVNCLALAAGRASLRATEAAGRRRREVADARDALARALLDVGGEPLPSETNFVLVPVDVDDSLLCERLAARGILVRAGSELGLPRHVRITVGEASQMQRVASEMREASSGPEG